MWENWIGKRHRQGKEFRAITAIFLRFYQANLFVHLAVSFPKMRGTQVGGRAAGWRVTLRRLGAQQEGFAVPGDAGGGLWLLRGWFLRKDLYLHAPPASPVRFGASLFSKTSLWRGLISAQGFVGGHKAAGSAQERCWWRSFCFGSSRELFSLGD